MPGVSGGGLGGGGDARLLRRGNSSNNIGGRHITGMLRNRLRYERRHCTAAGRSCAMAC